MPRTLTASDRKSLIRLASSLEKGSAERRAILAGLQKVAMEHASPEALKKYLKERPKADPKNHTVKKSVKKSPADVKKSLDAFDKAAPGGGWGVDMKKVEKMVQNGANLDVITKAITDGGGEDPKMDRSTKKLWDWLNSELE